MFKSILAWGLSQAAGEGLRKMALARKAGHEGNLAYRQVALFEQMLRGLQTPIEDILMRTFADRLPKAARKMEGAQSALLGNLG